MLAPITIACSPRFFMTILQFNPSQCVRRHSSAVDDSIASSPERPLDAVIEARITMTLFSVRTLGFPEIRRDDRLCELPLRKGLALLIYLAYLVLRNSMTDMDKRARIGAVYNIFAFAMLLPTIWIIPRLMESLHPGGMGNPALDTHDIDSRMRVVFWPGAVPGWTLLGVWITTLRIRLAILTEQKEGLHPAPNQARKLRNA